jgi:c-di-GMP-binding flagellar brake protein YcgR
MAPVRKHPRYPVNVPLFVSIANSVVRKWVQIETRDVSQGGLCFETGAELPLRSRARIMVGRLGGGLPDSAQIKARIAYRQRVDDSGRYRVGIEFEQLVDVTQKQLERWLEDWREQAGSGD